MNGTFCDICRGPLRYAPGDYLCSGCGAFICEKHADAPWGDHDKEDHTECSVCGEAGHFDGECDE